MRRIIVWTTLGVCLLTLSSTPATAQATFDPTKAQFTASADHNATVNGTPVVQSYQLELYLQGASAPFQTADLGKPAPDASNTITVDLTTVFVGWPLPGTIYESDVAAVGPGGSSKSTRSNTFTFSTQCSATVAPLTLAAGGSGGPGTANVTAASGCQWTATSGASWITVTSGASGAGNGTVNYSVAVNTLPSVRTGTLTIAGQTVTVTQAAACSFTLAPTTQAEPAAGGPATANVTTVTGCAWTAASNVSWITITSGASGNASGTVNYTVAANTTTAARTGTLTIAGQTLTVNQSAPCTFTVAPTTDAEPAAGGSSTVNVTTQGGCTWTAASNASWITVTAGATGTGTGTATYTTTANTGTSARTGTLTIAGQTVTVNQSAPCSFTLAPTTQAEPAAGGTATANVTTQSGCAWTGTSNVGWITVTSGASGSGNGTVGYSVAVNTSTSSRTGTLTIAGKTLTVTQDAACSFTVSPTTQSIPGDGGTATAGVTVTTGTSCSWTAASNVGWITVTAGATGTGNGTVSYSIAANTSSSPRTGTLTVAGQTVTVTEDAACAFTVTPLTLTVPAAGGNASVSVASATGCDWTASTSALWLQITSGATGVGSGTVAFTASSTTSPPRTGTLTVAGQTVTITEASAPTAPTGLRVIKQ